MPVTFDYAARRSALQQAMAEAGVDVAFIAYSSDLEYLTGLKRRLPSFGNSEYTHHWVAGGLIGQQGDPVLVLPRMISQFELPAGLENADVITVGENDDGPAIVADVARRFGAVGRLGVSARAWAEAVLRYQHAFGGAALVDVGPLVNRLRRIKSAAEIETMTRAAHIADGALAAVLERLAPGVTEQDVAAELNHRMRRLGSVTESFDTSVRTMGPHSDRDASVRLSSAPLRRGMSVVFDFGAVVDGYCSDFGRAVHLGDPGDEYREVYRLVIAAQEAGIAAVRPGATAADVHDATRKVIVDGGYGEHFRHRTGHCIGLDVHEKPFISEEDQTPLEAGMTFTIEPSVYWTGRVGVRIEDVILCTADGGRKLNVHPSELAVLD